MADLWRREAGPASSQLMKIELARLTAPPRPVSDQSGSPQSGPRLEAVARERSLKSMLQAFALLARRGPGGTGWAAPFREDPLAFLLDTVGDAVNLYSTTGELLYQNRAASDLGLAWGEDAPQQQFQVGTRLFECRCLRCGSVGSEYVLEIIRELPVRV